MAPNVRRSVISVLILAGLACGLWPPPKLMHANGNPMNLCKDFRITTNVPSPTLQSAIQRSEVHFRGLLRKQSQLDGNCLGDIPISIKTSDETLTMETDYSYSISTSRDTAAVHAMTAYGAMYALETLLQLAADGALQDAMKIEDSPDYLWRGLMVDSGRRFFPVPLLKDLMDTMAAVKMNVLHLHASDMCRFGVESAVYPNLTAALVGQLAGFYSVSDLKDIITYATARGIRVVPEFDVPGHSRGFIPVESQGAVFCTDAASRSQLYGDPDNKTFTLLHAVLQEMAGLFPDPVFHLGCDETGVIGPCTLASTFSLERHLLTAVQQQFNKTPAGWEEILFDAGAATPSTIVFAWARHTASEVTATQHKVVENSGSHFYLTEPGAAGPAGWSRSWYDISTGVPAAQRSLVLGGEMPASDWQSMWTDTYCYIAQCGSSSGSTPVGAALFDPAQDRAFSASIGGMIWPRSFVGAASFWHYNASLDPASPAVVAAIANLTQNLISRGQLVCPVGCYCDQLSACGTPYLLPNPGSATQLQPCAATTARWTLSGGLLQLAENTSLCLEPAAGYPATLQVCSSAVTHTHDGQLQGSGDLCLDLSTANGTVGWYECGSGQPNQRWGLDPDTGFLTSLGNYGAGDARSDYGGMCVTV